MLSKPLIWIVVAVTLLFIVGIFFYSSKTRRGYCHDGQEHRGSWMVHRMAKHLDLSEPQKEKLHQIKEEMYQKKAEFKGMRGEFIETFKSQLEREEVDKVQLNQFLSQKEKKITEMRTFMVDKLHEFHATLTPEQKQKLLKKLDRWHNKCRN